MSNPQIPFPFMIPRIKETAEARNELQQAVYDFADALDYPVDNGGRRYDIRFLKHLLCYHLPRVGGRIHPELAVIKKRRLPPSPGVWDDACEWVPLSAPDSIDDELAGASMHDLSKLSRAARAEAIRRLGGDGAPVNPDPNAQPWHVQTHISFDDGKGHDGGDTSDR